MWKNFAIATDFIVAIIGIKADYISFFKSSFTSAKCIIRENCRSVRLIIIQNTDILLIIINTFHQSQKYKNCA